MNCGIFLDTPSWKFGGPDGARNHELNLDASKKNFKRGVAIYNQFIKLADALGYNISISGSKTVFIIDSIALEFRIREKLSGKQRIDNKPIFQLIYDRYNTKTWEGLNKDLEELFPLIIAYFEKEAEDKIERKRQAEIENIRREKEYNIAKAKYAIHLDEYNAFNSLITEYERWKEAQKVREFALAKKNNGASDEWYNWAKSKADYIDPLVDSGDDILGEYPPKKPVEPRNTFW